MTRISKNGAVEIEDRNTKQMKLVAGHKVKKYWRSLCDLPDPAPAEVDLVTAEKSRLDKDDLEKGQGKRIKL